jgi:hypothetical protein
MPPPLISIFRTERREEIYSFVCLIELPDYKAIKEFPLSKYQDPKAVIEIENSKTLPRFLNAKQLNYCKHRSKFIMVKSSLIGNKQHRKK